MHFLHFLLIIQFLKFCKLEIFKCTLICLMLLSRTGYGIKWQVAISFHLTIMNKIQDLILVHYIILQYLKHLWGSKVKADYVVHDRRCLKDMLWKIDCVNDPIFVVSRHGCTHGHSSTHSKGSTEWTEWWGNTARDGQISLRCPL